MTAKDSDADGPISFEKRVSAEKAAAKRGTEPASTDTASTSQAAVPRPKQIPWVVAALGVTGLAAVGASLSLFGLHGWLVHQLTTSNNKLKASDQKTHAEVLHQASSQPTTSLISSVIFLLVLAVVARALLRGRYWSRWAVIGVWLLASFTGSVFGGFFQIAYVFQDAPVVFKILVTLSALAFIVAVALVAVVRPVVTWLNLSKPARPAPGQAPARRGLFAPRDPVRAARRGYAPPSAGDRRTAAAPAKVRETAQRTEDLFRGDSTTERARAKQRMTTETRDRGVEAARARAKSGKSRRTSS